MKKVFLLSAAMVIGIVVSVSAQEKMKVEKKVEVSEKNGIREVTVTEKRDGKTTQKIYKGNEAEAFLEQIEKEEQEMNNDADVEVKELKVKKK
jgi:hypothetical protein